MIPNAVINSHCSEVSRPFFIVLMQFVHSPTISNHIVHLHAFGSSCRTKLREQKFHERERGRDGRLVSGRFRKVRIKKHFFGTKKFHIMKRQRKLRGWLVIGNYCK